MNRAVVIRATAGLMAYLVESLADQPGLGSPPKVVIGYDARHHSAQLARDTAAVVVAAGGRALLWERDCPTPLLAYAVRQMNADAGVMVTASHNPAPDNGYKVYLGGRMALGAAQGVQIVAPVDQEIAQHITAAPPAHQVSLATRGWESIGGDQEREYLRAAVRELAPVPGANDLRIVYTAMHGVGTRIALPALKQAGFTDVQVVPEQAEPDPDFPTVPFPNPEEPGGIDRANVLAERIGADLVLAHDPDADRCAVAVYDPREERGGAWRRLTGDEVGALLGEETAKAWSHQNRAPDGERPTLACSIVSSRLLGRISRHHLLRYQETLTGFKWLARTPGLVFGYEEAIGYCTNPDLVRDKDGITAALAVARLAARAKLAQKSLIDLLDDLYRQHGLHLTGQVALRFPDASRLSDVMRTLRRAAPARIGEVAVTRTTDLGFGWVGNTGSSRNLTARGRAGDVLPPADVLIYALADSSRVVVRPSGTEPKVKCYLEVIQPVSATASFTELTELRRQATDRLTALATATRALLEPLH
jgi:phosphomannomutase